MLRPEARSEPDIDAVADSASARLRQRLERMRAADARGVAAMPAAIEAGALLPMPTDAREMPVTAVDAAPDPSPAAAAPVERVERQPVVAEPGPVPVDTARPVAAPIVEKKVLARPPEPKRPARAAVDVAATAAAAAPLQPPSALASGPDLTRLGKQGELAQALAASKRALISVGWFSCAINILMLTGPIFMLQVYDRVMTSGSVSTLVVLFVLTTAMYGLISMFEFVRSRVITRVGIEIDQRIGDRVFEAGLRKSIGGGSAIGALRELDTLRAFAAGPAPMTAFDAVWTPIYMLVIYLTHWSLGLAGTIGAVILLAVTYASERQSRGPLMEANKAAQRGLELAETGQRNADAVMAMGMLSAYRARWQRANQEALAWQVLASDRLGSIAALSKGLRLLLQSMMLALGAFLAVRGDITAGAIIAGTIIYGRALAPVEQIIQHWRSATKAYEAYKKLEALLAAVPKTATKAQLPTPKGVLQVEALRVAAPETRTLILSNVSFEVGPGKMLAVIGPSASGKSSLVRTLVNIWQPFSGTIRLDGARLDQWNVEELGRHFGYLPQDVELFAGTVRDNIARFRTDATDSDVIAAAKAAFAHDLIVALPKGYDTELGAFGTHLSAGQRQRIGLARALFGRPALIVLDEPNANLDREGDEALAAAIDGMRARGQTIVLVSHRVQAIGKADLLLFLERGVQRAFGPRDDVLRMIQGQAGGGDKAQAAKAGMGRPQPAQGPAHEPARAAAGGA